MRIVAMGGGGLGAGETLAMDRELIALSGTSNPRALFIPTASEDSEEYVEQFQNIYGAEGCSVEVIRFWSHDDGKSAREKLERADLVYVGGGNTKRMIAKWRSEGFDEALTRFISEDRPVGGLSAGAICWFRIANSDWPQFEGIAGVNTAPLDCLGYVDLALCPHTRDEGFRLAEFGQMMRSVDGVGIGLDDCCAIQIADETYRIIASQELSVAHRLFMDQDKLRHEILEPHPDFRPLSELRDTPKTIGIPAPSPI